MNGIDCSNVAAPWRYRILLEVKDERILEEAERGNKSEMLRKTEADRPG